MQTRTTIAVFSLCVTFFSQAQVQQPPYKVYDTRTKSLCSLQKIIEQADNYDVLFFGEEHNDSIAHVLQDSLYKALINRYKTVTLSMEMFERDCQLVLDEYLKGFITESQLIREGRAWKNYDDYAPVVNTAKQYRQHVVAANAPRRYVNLVSRAGLGELDKLDKASKKNFAPLPLDTTDAVYAGKFRTLMGGHGSKNMFYAQTLWDASMAHSIFTHWKKNKNTKIFHLNGKFHTDERLGTAAQLQRKNKKLRIGTISCFSADDFLSPDWSKHETLGDFVIVTDPRVPKSF